ncbi:MAG: hypothetical protein M3401_03680 [Actinomycetota bacterium]|nr:hypothetical protein [Actinomycetota bacterium]
MALGASACGEDDKKLGKAEFVRKANAICTKFEKKGSAIPEPSGAGSDKEDLERVAAYLDKSTPVVEGQHKELNDLEPKDGALAKKWNTYLDGLRSAVDDLEEAREKAKDGDKAGMQAAAKRLQANDADAEPALGNGACAD